MILPFLLVNGSSERSSHSTHVTQRVSGGGAGFKPGLSSQLTLSLLHHGSPQSCDMLSVLWWIAESHSLPTQGHWNLLTAHSPTPSALRVYFLHSAMHWTPSAEGTHQFPISFRSNISYVPLRDEPWA